MTLYAFVLTVKYAKQYWVYEMYKITNKFNTSCMWRVCTSGRPTIRIGRSRTSRGRQLYVQYHGKQPKICRTTILVRQLTDIVLCRPTRQFSQPRCQSSANSGIGKPNKLHHPLASPLCRKETTNGFISVECRQTSFAQFRAFVMLFRRKLWPLEVRERLMRISGQQSEQVLFYAVLLCSTRKISTRSHDSCYLS